jgi:hypothetical protein
MAFCFSVFASTDSLTMSFNAYFSMLKRDFNTCAVFVSTGKKAKHANEYFIKTLKKHQPLFSLLLTNEKGKAVSEVVRGEKPLHAKKNIAKQSWYLKTRKALKPYDGLTKEENGRFYLVWCIPLIRSAKGHQKYEGVMVAKIDLWDGIHHLAETTKEPFCVRMRDKTLYTHDWESQRIFVEDTLTIPGANNISIRYQKSGVSPVLAVQPSESVFIAAKKELSEAAQKKVEDAAPAENAQVKPGAFKVSKTNVPIVVGLIALICVITIVLIMQLIGRIRHLFLMKSIDKQDRL